MKNSELIKHIEEKYDVKSVQYKSLSLWLELRSRIYLAISLGQESTLTINTKTYKAVFKTMFYGFFNWFRPYDTWIFSAKINRLNIDGKYHDRLYEYIGEKFKKSLFIEVTTDFHYNRSCVESKYIVSKSALILLEKVIGLFISTRGIDISEIERIKKDFKINYNPNYAIKKMIAQYRVMRFLLFFKKPKIVFLSPAYTAYGYVKALKEKGVKVIEVQHGVILKEHFGYNIKEVFSKDYFVDNILTFGEQEIEVFKNGKGINYKNVIPVGNFYLDYIHANYSPDEKLAEVINNYKKSFVVSLQEIDKTASLIPNILASAKTNPDYLFILKPRKKSVEYYESTYENVENVIFIQDINIYQLILQTDFHVTVYSTCAIEAPALGRKNILFNINNLSKDIFEHTLTNSKTSVYVDDVDEFNKIIQNIGVPNELEVRTEHGAVLKSNYKKNIDLFIQNLKDE